jgi:glycosyltransferase involved in cell wall biosynthesis
MSSTAPLRPTPPPPAASPAGAPQVDVVIPVHDEEAALAPCVRRLHAHLGDRAFPFSWRIVIADNASTDATARVAAALAAELPGVTVLSLTAKGRGRARRAAWGGGEAEGVC